MKLHFTTLDHHQQPLQHKNKPYNHTLTQTRRFVLVWWHDATRRGKESKDSATAIKGQLIQKIILREHQDWQNEDRDTRLRDVSYDVSRRGRCTQNNVILLFFVLCFCVSALSDGTEEEESTVFTLALSIFCTVFNIVDR